MQSLTFIISFIFTGNGHRKLATGIVETRSRNKKQLDDLENGLGDFIASFKNYHKTEKCYIKLRYCINENKPLICLVGYND